VKLSQINHLTGGCRCHSPDAPRVHADDTTREILVLPALLSRATENPYAARQPIIAARRRGATEGEESPCDL